MSPYPDDTSLVQGLLNAEPKAFDELFVRYYETLKKWAHSRGVRPADCHDVAIDALVEAYKKIATYHGGVALKRWMAGFVDKMILRHRAGTSKDVSAEGLAEGGYEVPAPQRPESAPTSEARLHWADVELHLALLKNEQQRRAVYRYYHDEQNLEFIALELGLKNAESARQYVYQGVKALREVMGREPGEPSAEERIRTPGGDT